MLGRKFSEFDNFLFDLDGTLWYWDMLVPKALQVIQTLKNAGKNILFLTNNTMLTRYGMAKKLQGFDIDAKEEQIISPALPAIKLFKGKRIFCIGEGIITDLKKAKVRFTDSKPDAVLISQDRNLTWKKLASACDHVFNGSPLYKEAIGGIWFLGKKKYPGAGAIAAAVERCTGKEGILLGKPSKYMVDVIASFKLNPKKTILFGDECPSDIAIGNKLGFYTALVLSGATTEREYSSIRGVCEPKVVLKSVASILK